MIFAHKFSKRIFISSLCVILASCLNTEPKELGAKKITPAPTNTSNSSNFLFRYAWRDMASDGAAIGSNGVVFLKGHTNSDAAILSACNTSGSGCVCDFYANGATTATSSSISGLTPGISYYTNGNMILCKIPGAPTPASVAEVVVRNSSGSVSSSRITIKSTPALSDILGDLSAAKMRTISSYTCKINYLQNAGVSSSPFSFNCSAGAGGVLNYLQLNFKYYLFADNTANNYSNQVADLLYNGGSTICGLQIKQVDCTAAAPANEFGIYAESTGGFKNAVSLAANPNASTGIYGYGAEAITTNATISATTLCPPGLVKREIYTSSAATPTEGSCASAGTFNNMAALTNTIVSTAGAVPTAATIDAVTGGSCNGVTCTVAPTVSVVGCDTTTNTYAAAATPAPFCVIPASYLP